MEPTSQPYPDDLSLPELSKPLDIQLTPREEALLQGVHRGYARLILEKEFGGGYSGSRVFLVLPVRTDGGSDARVVSKIGPAVELSREKANFDKYIKQALPFTGTQVGHYYEQDDLAALNYMFAGGDELGETVNLEGYYSTHSAEEVIRTLRDLLNFLGTRWYSQCIPLNCSLREEYGRHLPPHAELEGITAKIFPRLIMLDSDRLQFPAIPDRYPNPLKVYPRLLGQVLEGRQSYVHGDLHLRNVLVDKSGKSWLIDFAKVRQRHNLFDFIKLEAYLRLMALATVYGAFSHREYLQFEAALNNTQLPPPPNQELRTAYRTILAIREMAAIYMRNPRNLSKEYLPALFLYCLALMKYHPVNGDTPTQLMFLTCCALGQFLLEGEHPGSETFLLESDVSDRRHDPLEAAYPHIALPKHVTVAETTQLLVLMRQGDSQELKTITETEVASAVKNEIIQSPPFELEFPLTKNGQPAPVELNLELDAPNFTPALQHHLIPVPLTGDPQFCAFHVTPNITGELPLTLRIYKDDLCISSYPLHISSGPGNSASSYSGVISILLNVTVEQVAQSFPGGGGGGIPTGDVIETKVTDASRGTYGWRRSLKWWGIGVFLVLLAVMGVGGSWFWANGLSSNKPTPIPSIIPAITSLATLSPVSTDLLTPATPLPATPIPGDSSENMSLVIVEKLEDRSHGGYRGTDPAQSIYQEIAAQVQKDELPLDVRYLEQAPDNAMLNQAGEKALPILVLSGWHDSTTITFRLELFAIIDQFNIVQKTDEFNGTIKLSGHEKYLALFVLGTDRYIGGDDDTALDYLNNALLYIRGEEAVIKPADVHYLRGLIFHGRGVRDRAIAEYTQAIGYRPEIAEYYNCRGAAEDETRRYEQAIEDYGRAISIQPDLAKFYTNRGNAYAHMGDYTHAISDYTHAIELETDYVEAYHYRGIAYDHIGDYVHAIADYTQAIQIQPGYAEAYSDRGTAYYNQEEIDQAIADYTEAIAIDPELQEAYNNRGNAYRRKGLYELALIDLNKAIDLDPRDYIAYYNRGLTYEEMGETEKAIADFKEALALDPSPEVQQRVEQELKELGEN